MGIEAGWTLGYDKLGRVGDILNRVVVDLGFGDSLMGVEAGSDGGIQNPVEGNSEGSLILEWGRWSSVVKVVVCSGRKGVESRKGRGLDYKRRSDSAQGRKGFGNSFVDYLATGLSDRSLVNDLGCIR